MLKKFNFFVGEGVETLFNNRGQSDNIITDECQIWRYIENSRTQREQVEFVNKFITIDTTTPCCVHTESDIIINAVRVAIKESRVSFADVAFFHVDGRGNIEQIKPDKDGRLSNWPWGFCTMQDDLLNKLLSRS